MNLVTVTDIRTVYFWLQQQLKFLIKNCMNTYSLSSSQNSPPSCKKEIFTYICTLSGPAKSKKQNIKKKNHFSAKIVSLDTKITLIVPLTALSIARDKPCRRLLELPEEKARTYCPLGKLQLLRHVHTSSSHNANGQGERGMARFSSGFQVSLLLERLGTNSTADAGGELGGQWEDTGSLAGASELTRRAALARAPTGREQPQAYKGFNLQSCLTRTQNPEQEQHNSSDTKYKSSDLKTKPASLPTHCVLAKLSFLSA